VIVVKMKGIPGDCDLEGYSKGEWFVADSLKYGTEDPDKAKDALTASFQVCEIKKSVDAATCDLMRAKMNGNAYPIVEARFIETAISSTKANETINFPFMMIKLGNVHIAQWEMDAATGEKDDRPTETIKLWFNKLAMKYFSTEDGKNFKQHNTRSWDVESNSDWKNANFDVNAAGQDKSRSARPSL